MPISQSTIDEVRELREHQETMRAEERKTQDRQSEIDAAYARGIANGTARARRILAAMMSGFESPPVGDMAFGAYDALEKAYAYIDDPTVTGNEEGEA